MNDNRQFFAQFSTREHEVLVCLLAGDTNPQIASYCAMSVSSVKRCVSQLLKAAEVRRRADLRARWESVAFAMAAAA